MDIVCGKGSTEFGIGRALCALAQCILRDEKRVLPVSALLCGEYGQSGLHCGVPCLIGRSGVGYPIAALVCGALAGLCTALLQTRARVEPILSGILVSTGLYTVNYALLGGQSNLYLQREVINAQGTVVNESCQTLYRMFSRLLKDMGSPLKDSDTQVLLLTLGIVAALIVLLGVFFFSRPGMAISGTAC